MIPKVAARVSLSQRMNQQTADLKVKRAQSRDLLEQSQELLGEKTGNRAISPQAASSNTKSPSSSQDVSTTLNLYLHPLPFNRTLDI